MKKTELLKLVLNPDVFHHVSYLLVSLGLVQTPSDKNPAMSRLVLTEAGERIISTKPAGVSQLFIDSYRSLFTAYKKGEVKLVAENLSWLINTHECTEDQIIAATNAYLRTVDDKKYCQQADFFIYKNLTNGAVRSTILTFLNGEDLEKEEEGYGWEVV